MSLQIEATPPVGGLDTQMVLDDKAGLAQRELLVLQPADHPPILAWEIRVLGPTFLALLAGGGLQRGVQRQAPRATIFISPKSKPGRVKV